LLPALDRPTHMDRLTYGVGAAGRTRRDEIDKVIEYRHGLRRVLLLALPEHDDSDPNTPNAPLSVLIGRVGSVAIIDLYTRLSAMLGWTESMVEVAVRVRSDRPLRAALARLHRA